MLTGRGGADFSFPRALLMAASWGAGAAIGVALGGWLTLVGGSGAPGAAGLDPVSDLVALPGIVFAGVLVVHLCAQLVAAVLRGRAVEDGRE